MRDPGNEVAATPAPSEARLPGGVSFQRLQIASNFSDR